MPSSEYYRRQADTLLAMALSIHEPRLSTLCRTLALQYKFLSQEKKADAVEAPDRRDVPAPPEDAAEAD